MICPISNLKCSCPKNLHIVEIQNPILEFNVCDQCPILESKRKTSVSDEYINSKEELLAFFGQAIVKKCPKCGTTLEDFKKTNMVGCGNCYSVFKENMTSVGYNGKLPKTQTKSILMTRMDLAVRNEQYEKAHEIKLKLLNLE